MMCMSPLPSITFCGGGPRLGWASAADWWCPPGADVVVTKAVFLLQGSQVAFAGVRGAGAVGWVDVAVPLADPGHGLSEAGEQGRYPFGSPPVRVGALLDKGDQDERLLQLIPPGPAEKQRAVIVRAG